MRWQYVRYVVLMFGVLGLAPTSLAQTCPDAGAALTAVRNAINELGKRDRAPAAADCAFRWASGLVLDSEQATTPAVVNFFLEASDLHRRAYEKRLLAGRDRDADRYLGDEITLRTRFLETALQTDLPSTDPTLRRAAVRHISFLTGALALRQQFAQVDKVLSNTDAGFIDGAAVNVWLQALWSCAKFDGVASNLCAPDNRLQCRERAAAFLTAIDEMKGRRFPPQTQRDIAKLRTLTGKDGCLK